MIIMEADDVHSDKVFLQVAALETGNHDDRSNPHRLQSDDQALNQADSADSGRSNGRDATITAEARGNSSLGTEQLSLDESIKRSSVQFRLGYYFALR
jgi:hypothetical protein